MSPAVCRPLAATAAAVFALASFAKPAGGAVTPSGEVRQPRNIYELIYGIDHTLRGFLKGDELEMFSTMSPEQIKAARPDLYERVSQDVKAWTDEWLAHVQATAEPIPSGKLNDARTLAGRVDSVLREHFTARQWPYHTMRVVWLPPKLFLDERQRNKFTGGMFIPFYPEAFFATVDWPMPLGLVLVHESLHFNKAGPIYGHDLDEAITEVAARDLAIRYGLATSADIRRDTAYIDERKGVDYLLEEMTRRAGMERDAALEIFIEAYLTGRQEKMAAVFGAPAWSRVIRLGDSRQTWQTHRIAKALEGEERP